MVTFAVLHVMVDICCIGHITLDKVVTAHSVTHMPGGTSFYFSNAIKNFDVSFALITAVGEPERYIINQLREQGIDIKSVTTQKTVYFENIYSENQNHRTQRVLQEADPFDLDSVTDIEAKIYHLGPLLTADIPTELIQCLSQKGIVSLDVQGYLRRVNQQKVYYTSWQDKEKALPHIHILKANEFELEALTGTTDIEKGIKILADYGVSEIVITLGSMGSILYKDEIFYQIPAYTPYEITDATGCGDTYMAGYLYKKTKGCTLIEAGNFAAAMSTLKIQTSEPFRGQASEVMQVLQKNQSVFHDFHIPYLINS